MLFLLSLVSVDNEFNTSLVVRRPRTFVVLARSISKGADACRYARLLAFVVLCNLCYKEPLAQEQFLAGGVFAQIRQFLVDEREHFAIEELQELRWAVGRVMRPECYGELFEEDSRRLRRKRSTVRSVLSRSLSEVSRESDDVRRYL